MHGETVKFNEQILYNSK